MNKKGFTIVELMATLAIMSIIMVIGTYSLMGLNKAMKKDLWTSKEKLIERAAVKYGEDHKNILKKKSCASGKQKCMEIKVQTLINRGYLATKEYEKGEDGKFITDEHHNKIKTITNDTLDPSDPNYYINQTEVRIYIEKGYVYAKYNE